jgi:hypothetical protein
MKRDLDDSDEWMAFRARDRFTKRLFKQAEQIVTVVLDDDVGPDDVVALLMSPETREEATMLGMLVIDSFIMMGEREYALKVLRSLYLRLK